MSKGDNRSSRYSIRPDRNQGGVGCWPVLRGSGVCGTRRTTSAKLGAGDSYFGSAAWDLAPDGKRVIVAVQVESSEAPKQEHEVVFLQNFEDELQRRVPLGK